MAVVSVLKEANILYTKYDADRSGELSLDEVVTLLNSEEYRAIFQPMGIEVPKRDMETVKVLFDQVDNNKSGTVSRPEFIAMWAALVKDRCSADPRMVALGLCTFLDANGDGKLQASELKRFLPLFGLKGVAVAALPVPDWAAIEYRKVLS